jgi:hypothetical protein
VQEKTKKNIEVLDDLKLFIDKKVIFDEIFFPSVRRGVPSTVCQQFL